MMKTLGDSLVDLVRNDDVPGLKALVAREPEGKKLIREPIGPFNSPVINQVQSPAMLDALLEAGADINARSQWWAGGFGLLDHASEELARYAVERGARLDAHAAARLGWAAELRRLLDANPGAVHSRGGDGKTPLHWAGTVEVARILVEHGADVNARDVDHESTPAQYLIGDHPEIVQYLLSKGADADIFIAAALGDLALAERLVQTNPDCLRARVNAEYFPMKNPHAGGTIYQWTLGFNVSPHEVAHKFGQARLFEWLKEQSPAEVRLLVACWMGEEAATDNILASAPGITERLRPSEARQIADAARNNNAEATRLMVKAGLPLNARGQHGATPLHWVAWHGNVDLVQLLVSRGADLEDSGNEFRGTPLDWALHGSENGWNRETGDYPAVVRALLAAGARMPTHIRGTPAVRQILESHRSA